MLYITRETKHTGYGLVCSSKLDGRLEHGLNAWKTHEYGLKVFLICQEIFKVLSPDLVSAIVHGHVVYKPRTRDC